MIEAEERESETSFYLETWLESGPCPCMPKFHKLTFKPMGGFRPIFQTALRGGDTKFSFICIRNKMFSKVSRIFRCGFYILSKGQTPKIG